MSYDFDDEGWMDKAFTVEHATAVITVCRTCRCVVAHTGEVRTAFMGYWYAGGRWCVCCADRRWVTMWRYAEQLEAAHKLGGWPAIRALINVLLKPRVKRRRR